MDLAEIGLTFPTSALRVLYFVLVATRMLVTYSFLGHCWAAFTQHWSSLPPHTPPSESGRLGVSKTAGGAKTIWPKLTKISRPYDVMVSNKGWEKGWEGGRVFVIKAFVLQSNTLRPYFPGRNWTSSADIVREYIILFFHTWSLGFFNQTTFIFTHAVLIF